MTLLDGSVVTVALPVLQVDLHATTTGVQWVMEVYMLFLAAFILVGGILGDHYGRRRIFAIGIVIFTLASVCCGFAPSLALLLLARAIQGLGGALLVPGSLAIISGSFSDQQRERAIGIWSGWIAIASVLGPVAGGWLVQHASWRLADHVGAKLPPVFGPVIMAVSIALFAVPTIGGMYWVTFFPAVLVMGLGMAINVAPMTTVVMGAVEQRHAGIASAINSAVARVGSLLAIAVLGIVIISAFNSSLDSHLAHLPLSPVVRHIVDAQRVELAGIQLPAGTNGQVHTALKHAVDESFVSGFRLVALICAVLALASALCGWLMIEDKPSKRASRAVTGERAVKEHELAVSTVSGRLPGSHP